MNNTFEVEIDELINMEMQTCGVEFHYITMKARSCNEARDLNLTIFEIGEKKRNLITFSMINQFNIDGCNACRFFYSIDREPSPQEMDFLERISYKISNKIICFISDSHEVVLDNFRKSNDSNSFADRCLKNPVPKIISFDAASVYVSDNLNNYLVLSATTGLKELKRGKIKKSDVQYPVSDTNIPSRSFLRDKAFLYDESESSQIHIDEFIEDVRFIKNRAYIPISNKSNLRGVSNDEVLPPVGVIVITNIKFIRSEADMNIKTIEFFVFMKILEQMSAFIFHLKFKNQFSRHIDRITHGIITDLSTLKLSTQLFRIRLEKYLPKFSHLQKENQHAKNDINVQAREYFETILNIQDSMSFQISSVSSEKSLDAVTNNKDKAYSHILFDGFQRIESSLGAMAHIYNKRSVKFTAKRSPQINLNINNAPLVAVPKGVIYTVLRNLFENSIKYTHKNTEPHIDVMWKHNSQYLFVLIQDNSIGVEEGDSISIFREGFRGNNAIRTALRGSGIGLSASRTALREFGGELRYYGSSKISKTGAAFELIMPIYRLNDA